VTPEFLARHAGLGELPIIQNPRRGHELRLTAAEADTVEALLAQLEAEYQRPGKWQQRLLGAYPTVLLTHLSRLCTAQYPKAGPTPDQRLLRAHQAEVESCFREVHEVGAYAERLHISAGHLSEVVKAQTGRPAIKHLHERLVLEARRLLHTQQPLKEIAYDLSFQDAATLGQKTSVLDVLVNNVGILGGMARPATSTSLDTIREVYATNVFGVSAITQACLGLRRQSPAPRIVNVTSGLGSPTLHTDLTWKYYHVKGAAYQPSKAALNAYTIMLAYELRDTSFKVNAVDPGYTATVQDAAARAVKGALLGPDGPTSQFFSDDYDPETGISPW